MGRDGKRVYDFRRAEMLNYPMACEWTRGGSAMSRQGSKERKRERGGERDKAKRKKEKKKKKERGRMKDGEEAGRCCSCISLHVEFS